MTYEEARAAAERFRREHEQRIEVEAAKAAEALTRDLDLGEGVSVAFDTSPVIRRDA